MLSDFRERSKRCKLLMKKVWEHQSRAAGRMFETRPQTLRYRGKSETIRWNRALHPYELFWTAHKGFMFGTTR